MIGNLIGGIVEGYAGTTMEKQKTERQAAGDSANRRLKLITSILPDITDPSLRAEAISMAEEIAGGPKKKGGGGLGGIISNLLGKYETDEPQKQQRFQEFIQRPRSEVGSERPPLEQPGGKLPPVPGGLSSRNLGQTKGLLEPGNIDLTKQPVVKNQDGSTSTVYSESVNVDGKEILIPRVAHDGSRVLNSEEAFEQYRKTGKHLGVFDSPESATAYAQELHEDYAQGRIPGYNAVDRSGPTIGQADAFPGLSRSLTTTAPGLPARTVKGPFSTPEEMSQMKAHASAADTLADLQAKNQAAEERRNQIKGQIANDPALAAQWKQLTPAQQVEALYPEMRLGATAGMSPIAGTLPGSSIKAYMPVDSLGQPIDDTKNYHATRDSTGRLIAAYPAAETTHVTAGEYQPDAESTTGYSRLLRDFKSGKIVRVERDIMPPAGFVPTTSTSNSVRFVPQPDGTLVATPVTTTTTRSKNLPGQPGGTPPGLSPVPGTAPAASSAGQPGTVVGRKPVPTPVKKTIGEIKMALRFAEELNQLLETPDASGKPLSQRTEMNQQVADMVKARVEALKYQVGYSSGNPIYKTANPLSSLLKVLTISPYLRGLRNMLWVNQIGQHIPDATTQSPAAMMDRLKVVREALQGMRQDIMDQEGLDEARWNDPAMAVGGAAQPRNTPSPAPRKAAGAIPPEPKW